MVWEAFLSIKGHIKENMIKYESQLNECIKGCIYILFI